jgi:hypothetical protein
VGRLTFDSEGSARTAYAARCTRRGPTSMLLLKGIAVPLGTFPRPWALFLSLGIDHWLQWAA